MSANISVELKKNKKNAFYDMAKQQCREVSPHATDKGKASIKKNMTNFGFGLQRKLTWLGFKFIKHFKNRNARNLKITNFRILQPSFLLTPLSPAYFFPNLWKSS